VPSFKVTATDLRNYTKFLVTTYALDGLYKMVTSKLLSFTFAKLLLSVSSPCQCKVQLQCNFIIKKNPPTQHSGGYIQTH